MLEESKMDKKYLNRSSVPQSRASAIDCKKSSETTHKPWPRNTKKREGFGNAPKNDPYRKRGAPAQGGRGQVDRRPRARAGPSNFLVGGAQNTGIEDDDEPELGSVFVPGSKKQNLNHLLNFTFASRWEESQKPERHGAIPRRGKRPPHRLEHDLYLRANCQFVVRENGNYKANLLDPDVPIKWEQIEEIVVRRTGRSECPICLGAPVAGRVGPCGHVYCWACALHYAAASEKQPPPCPVCAMPLNVKEMRSTRIVQWAPPSEEVTMRLVRRLRGSATVEIAPPRGKVEDSPADVLPLERINDAPYTKFFTINKQQLRDILEREKKEIQDQIMAEIDTSEIVYLEQALEMLKSKEKNLNALYDPPKLKEVEENVPKVIYEHHEINPSRMDWFNMEEVPWRNLGNKFANLDITDSAKADLKAVAKKFPGISDSDREEYLLVESLPDTIPGIPIPGQVDSEPEESPLDDAEPEEFPLVDCPIENPIGEPKDDNAVTDIDKQNQAKYFYFYQAEDGQQVFLHSVNVRTLSASWGALAAAPARLTARVLQRETMSLYEEMRKHMPYTAHLPLYCSFDVVELDLQPPYVTNAALNNFSEEIERRAKRRARIERAEKRRERAYRRAIEGPPRPDFSNEFLFPSPFSLSPPGDSPPSPPPPEPPAAAAAAAATSSASFDVATAAASPPGLSFAKMASSSGTWRVRKASAPPPPPPPDAEEGPAPRALSLSDAIEAALAAPAPSPSGKKKKKNKQKVLFATGMQRAD